jgi:hypothetical protein
MPFTLGDLEKDVTALGGRLTVAEECPDTLKEWVRRGTCFPSRLTEMLLADIPEACRIIFCCHGDGTGRFELRFEDAGERIATATRSFDLGKSVVKHAGFRIIPDRCGRGLGTLLTRNSLKVYKKVGISKVTLDAGLDVGGYVWARLGFVPTKDGWLQVRGAVRAKRASMGQIPSEAEVALGYALADDEPAAIWEIADLDARINGKSLGQVLLSGTTWEGMLDLTNTDAMDRISAYAAAKTSKPQ